MVTETLRGEALLSAFSDTYAEARQRFLDMASGRGAVVVSTVHPTERGARGEDLAIDIATFGDPSAEKTLLLVSGTHGQEGFLGSALQLAFLSELEVPDGVNVVALHALNPWGFSHLSRTDETNIDLNRNFGDLDEVRVRDRSVDEIQSTLTSVLCPEDWTEETLDWSSVRDDLLSTYGTQRVVTAVAGGQDDDPTGLMFTGRVPSWSREVVSDVLPRLLDRASKVAFIEWHTGLGAYAELSLICSLDPDSAGFQRVHEWMGEAARSPFEDSSNTITNGEAPSYRGFFSAWLPSTAPDADWAGFLIEVGTLDNVAVQDSVRIDRWLRFGTGRTTTPRAELKRTMMEALNPSSREWREKAMRQGLDAQSRMLEGLSRW